MRVFRKLYEENFNKVYYYLRSLCGNEKLAEDLTQETFYNVLVYICTGKGSEVCTGWLIKIAHNIFIDYVRKNRVNLNETLSLHDNEKTGVTFDSIKRLDLTDMLHKLPVRYRSIILLRDYYGFSYAEISKIMNCSESTVKVTLFRAREKFKEVYKKYERETLE